MKRLLELGPIALLIAFVVSMALRQPQIQAPVQPHLMAMSQVVARTPTVISSSISYFIDGQNTLGCASDNNNGTSATCASGGIGPLLTYGHLHDVVWTCAGPILACPTVRLATLTISLISAMAANDWMYLDPALDQGIVVVNATTPGTSIATGTISNFTALNRAAGTGTLTQMQLPVPGAGLVNATGGYPLTSPTPQRVIDSVGGKTWWVYKVSSGAISFVSEPMVPYTAPAVVGTQYTVSNPANTDAVTIYNPITINYARAWPTMINWDAAQNGGVWFQGLRFLLGSTPGVLNNGTNAALVGSYVNLLDCASDRALVKYAYGGQTIDVWQNVFAFNFQSGTDAGFASYNENVTKIAGGTFFEGNVWRGNRGSLVIDADTIMRDTRLGGAEVSCAYFDSNANCENEGGELTLITGAISGACTASSNQGLWTNPATPMALDLEDNAFLGTSAAREFRNVNVTLCGSGTACNGGDGTNLPSACNISITNTNIDAAFSGTAFGGTAWRGACKGGIRKTGIVP